MSSMIIPMMGGSSGASGGGSFIQVYADAPQYIEGKYLRVKLGSTEIYADSIPTNVDALTLQITEAGTYTIGLYSSSSASTATESHTVIVSDLSASPSVRFGDAAYIDKSETAYYYTASNTSIFTSPTISGTNTTYTDSIIYTKNYVPTYSGIVRLKLTGTLVGSSSTYNVHVRIYIEGKQATTTTTTTTSVSVSQSIDYPVLKDVPVEITVRIASENAAATTTFSSGSLKICGTANSYSVAQKGITANAVKSIQTGIAVISKSTTELYTIITIPSVNPQKTIVGYTFSGGTLDWTKPISPTQVAMRCGTTVINSSWFAIEYY